MTDPRQQIAALADEIATTVGDARLSTALKLAECKRIAEENGLDWQHELETVVRPRLRLAIGPREVRRLIEIGTSPDPQAALAEQRQESKERSARIRQGVRTPAPVVHKAPVTPIGRAIEAINELPPEQRKEVAALAGYQPKAQSTISPRDALIRAIDAVDDATFLDVITTHAWARLGMVMRKPELARGASKLRRTEPTTDFDPDTGEVIESASVLADGTDPFALPPMCDRRGGV